MIPLKEQLEKIHSKIENGKLLISVQGDNYTPINFTKYSFHDYLRVHFAISSRLDEINSIKNVVSGKTSIDELKNAFADRTILSAYNLIEELTCNIKFGDYVEFKQFGETIKGFVEETRFEYRNVNESITNIERTQFCHHNSWGNYIVKGVSLKYIKENLVAHKESELCSELLLDIDTLNSFLHIVNMSNFKVS